MKTRAPQAIIVSEASLFALLLFILPLLYFYPVIIGKILLAPGDGWAQNIGVRALTGQMIARGQLPLWNSRVCAGMPLAASVDPGALYPLNWIFALLPAGAAMNAVVVFSFYLALLGVYLFVRGSGGTRTGALASGMIFAFSGFAVAHLEQTHRITSLVWLPWVLLAVEKLAQSESWRAAWRWVMAGAFCLAFQILAGDPQTTFYAGLIYAAYGAFRLGQLGRLEQVKKWPRRMQLIGTAGVMAACGVLLAAIQLLPQQELMEQGERAKLSYDYFASYSFPPRQLLGLIFPYFFGGGALPPYRVSYWGEWNAGMIAVYVGLLSLMLATAAVLLPRQKARAIFWTAVAAISVFLCLGDYQPFGINHLLYHVPGYNLFRGAYRHLYEFSFAIAVLGGMGVDAIAQGERAVVRHKLRLILAGFAALLLLTAIVYLYRGVWLAEPLAYPAAAGRAGNAEFWLPLIVFAIVAAALWFYGQQTRYPRASRSLLLIVLLFDLASCSWFFRWRTVENRAAERLADPATIQFIKSREPNLHSFRAISQFAFPNDGQYVQAWENNFDLLNWPDVSSARDLQCITCADLLHLPRFAALAGAMDPNGNMHEPKALGFDHRGLDLLNAKYLLLERRPVLEPWQGVVFDGVTFSHDDLNIGFEPGVSVTTGVNPAAATELVVISKLFNSTNLPDGQPVLQLKLHTTDGRVIELAMRAGEDTSEWAYDRPDVRAQIKHKRARVAEDSPADGFLAHSYLARLPFARATIERIEWVSAGKAGQTEAGLHLVRASLYDAETKNSAPVIALNPSPERWRKLAAFGQVEVYENLRLLPRAWFVRHVEALPDDATLAAIKSGARQDGSAFDPSETALLRPEDFTAEGAALAVGRGADAQVNITRYEPQRIELRARNAERGFLVLSEIYYPGWEALIDGQPARIYRSDYTLRGVVVPAGEHQIEFVYSAPPFRRGAHWAALGLLLLLGGAVLTRRNSKGRA